MANKKKDAVETEEMLEETAEEIAEEIAEETVEAETEEPDELALAKEKADEYLDQLRRSMAEFDNFKKRTQKEKEQTYSMAAAETVGAFLPLVDNLERAYASAQKEETDPKAFMEGMGGILKQVEEILKSLSVSAIPAVGEPFDPNVHNAVMHVEDDSLGENTVAEEFQKGYQLKDRVIRHSMVKVAN